MDCWRGVHKEFGCGVRTAARESRPKSRFGEGTGAGARAEGARLACGRNAAKCNGLRSRKNLRLLRIRMRDWRETIDDENVARGCAGKGRADIGGDPGGAGSNRGGRGDGSGGGCERRASRQREMQSGGGGVRRDSYGGVAAAIGTRQRTYWAAFAFASGFECLRNF